MRKIFVSYHSSDRAVTQAIVNELKNANLDVWWDQDLRGERLTSKILYHINAADVVLILVSRNWLAAEWCLGEGEAAGSKRRVAVLEEGLINVLPLPFRARNILDLAGFQDRRNAPKLAKVIEACKLPDDAAQGSLVQSAGVQSLGRDECSAQIRAGGDANNNTQNLQVANFQGDNSGTINFTQNNYTKATGKN